MPGISSLRTLFGGPRMATDTTERPLMWNNEANPKNFCDSFPESLDNSSFGITQGVEWSPEEPDDYRRYSSLRLPSE